ncbi:MAG: hypothetical protein IJE43_22165 [Alphaproteobacteria bacterium]|nr:hypothetical protein [Alphaproteobacteria bacterium]MBQ6787666.1 hypothetical protein [Lachnospiraceae bacterium]
MFCGFCGNEVKTEDCFCGKCGNKIKNETKEIISYKAKLDRKDGSKRKVMISAMALAVVSVVSFGVSGVHTISLIKESHRYQVDDYFTSSNVIFDIFCNDGYSVAFPTQEEETFLSGQNFSEEADTNVQIRETYGKEFSEYGKVIVRVVVYGESFFSIDTEEYDDAVSDFYSLYYAGKNSINAPYPNISEDTYFKYGELDYADEGVLVAHASFETFVGNVMEVRMFIPVIYDEKEGIFSFPDGVGDDFNNACNYILKNYCYK